jgi:hypothetical protein
MDDWLTDSEEDLPRGILQVQVYDDRSNVDAEGEEVVFSHDEAPSDDEFNGVAAFDHMEEDSDNSEDEEEEDEDSDLQPEQAADFDSLIAADRETGGRRVNARRAAIQRANAERQEREQGAERMPGGFPGTEEREEVEEREEPEEDRVQCESSAVSASLRSYSWCLNTSRIHQSNLAIRF